MQKELVYFETQPHAATTALLQLLPPATATLHPLYPRQTSPDDAVAPWPVRERMTRSHSPNIPRH